VERILSPPYVAQSERRSDRIWAVYAFKIDVVRFGAWGDEIEVSRIDSTTTTTVDGRNGEPVPALDQLGERYGASFALTATRLDGDLWAVRGGAL
jgi:hypothetical protein